MLCKKCNQPFSMRVWINGKKRYLQHRKYCLNCSPFGSHNTRKLVEGSPKQKRCLRCGHLLRTNRRNYCAGCNVTKWRQRTKRKLVEYKGGACKICGYSRCIDNLTFHHRKPNEKEFQISSVSSGFEKIKVEVDKCELLCHNCHGEVHAGLLTLSAG